jgi:ATP-binding cassette, subfamily B, bacterial PglK
LIKEIFSKAFGLLPRKFRRQTLWIALLLVLNSFLDFFSIASFLPLISLIINPDFVSSNEFISQLYYSIGFSTIPSFIIALACGVLLIILIKNLLNVWITKTKVRYAFEIGQDLSSKAMLNYMEISFLDFSQADFSRELNRITNYPFAFANNIILPITTLISEMFICTFFLIGMAYYDFKMISLLLIILIPSALLYRIRKKSHEKLSYTLKEKYPALTKVAFQVIEGFPEIKTYGKESFFKEKFETVNKELTKAFIKDQTLQAATIRLTEIVVGVIICASIIYAVSFYQNYQQSLILLSIYSAASFRMIPSANRILHASQQIRMHQYLFEELRNKIYFKSTNAVDDGLTFNHSISLKNISFHYPNGPSVLKDVSLTIQKGTKVGIIGKSGEGKTSLLLILLRLLRETSGEILVDNKLIADASWKKILGYVPQNPYIIDGSLAENIAFGVPISDINREKILGLIKDLDLGELLQYSSEGIDARIGERGAKLSGGQKQRLAICRALYADASILLLDEVTSQIHSSIELEIMNLLDRLALKKTTIILVTHKIARENFFDAIYKLEKGALIQETIK